MTYNSKNEKENVPLIDKGRDMNEFYNSSDKKYHKVFLPFACVDISKSNWESNIQNIEYKWLCTYFRLAKPVHGPDSCALKRNQTKQANLSSLHLCLLFIHDVYCSHN